MKRYCKNVNILDFEFLEFCAGECLRKKWKRRDVLEFFSSVTGRMQRRNPVRDKNTVKSLPLS